MQTQAIFLHEQWLVLLTTVLENGKSVCNKNRNRFVITPMVKEHKRVKFGKGEATTSITPQQRDMLWSTSPP